MFDAAPSQEGSGYQKGSCSPLCENKLKLYEQYLDMQLRQLIISGGLFVIICIMIQPATAIIINGNETDDGTYYYNLGARLVAAGDFARAINAYDSALSSNTTIIRMSDGLLYTYRNKAFAQIQLGMFADAADTTNQGLALYPKDAPLWNNKGYSLFKLGRYPEAIAAYDQALAIDTNYTKGWINKGNTLFGAGRYQEAVIAYTSALATDPGNADATAGLARAQQKASEIFPVFVVAAIAAVAIIGGAVYYLIKGKKAGKSQKEKPVRKK
jgi:tetratricopeptide (TPR) repeat protein